MKSVLLFWSCVLGIKILLSSASYYQSQQSVGEITQSQPSSVTPDSTKQMTYEQAIKESRAPKQAQMSR